MLDDALALLDFVLEGRPVGAAWLACRGLEVREVVVKRRSEGVERFGVKRSVLLHRDGRDVDAPARVGRISGLRRCGLAVDAGIEGAATQSPGESPDSLVERLDGRLLDVGHVERLLNAGTGADLLGPRATEVELGGQCSHDVCVRLGQSRRERLAVGRERVEACVGKLVARTGRDSAGLQAHRLETVDHLAGRVQNRQVAVAEQFSDDGRRGVLALEAKLQDSVELELLDAGEFGPLDAIAKHHREVGRAVGRGRDVLGVGHPDVSGLAQVDEQLDAPPVEIAQLHPHEAVGIEVDLVDACALVGPEFARERREVDARQFPLWLHTSPSVTGPKGVSLLVGPTARGSDPPHPDTTRRLRNESVTGARHTMLTPPARGTPWPPRRRPVRTGRRTGRPP